MSDGKLAKGNDMWVQFAESSLKGFTIILRSLDDDFVTLGAHLRGINNMP